MKTTTIGAYPKPRYLDLPDWFKKGTGTADPTTDFLEAVEALGDHAEALFARAAKDVISDQENAGIDIVTDGEVRRENYMLYHVRHLAGIDYRKLTGRWHRANAFFSHVPTIIGSIAATEPFLAHDWRVAQSFSSHPVKTTIPGPFTLMDTLGDEHYGTQEKVCRALADAINVEVRALAAAGCKYIQIDEPAFVRMVPEALAFGMECLERAFEGCPSEVSRVVHICCSYPEYVDQPDPPKGPKEAYLDLAGALDACAVDAVSIEDAHRPNDLGLLEYFTKTTVLLGVVDIASSRVESAEEIRARLADALNHIDHERLLAAPDCGLGVLGRELALAKLSNMSEAARTFG